MKVLKDSMGLMFYREIVVASLSTIMAVIIVTSM